MRVITGGGDVIAIGTVEAAPTIGIIDYSRRETDAFGVTTVVQRGFARQMSVRVKIATDQVDNVQRQIAALRATPATWIADDRFDSLAVDGFFKDFSIDLAVPPVSYCTLTIEGLAEDGAFIDPGTDPAPDQRNSTLRLLQPLEVNSAMLASSSIPEADHAEWFSGATYALGARVILAATHRIYESAAAGNVGNDPAGASGLWIDIGPTNRWAMFDQALGSLTTADSVITLTLTPGQAVNALALLDVIATSVRVQTGAYDRTSVPSAAPGMVTFLDMPSSVAPVTVTIAGAGGVSVGTMLIGSLVGLGVTEAAPTAGITDYSRKETDGFGETTLVERAWAKRMNVRGLISTAALDVVAGRISAVRARPSLWIGHDSLESVTVYGFFKDFSIEVGDSVSILSLSIEGLSKAGKVAPLGASIDWPDIADPDGTKPDDNATNSANPTSPIGDETAGGVVDGMRVGLATTALEAIRNGSFRIEQEERQEGYIRVLDQVGVQVGETLVYISFLREVDSEGNAQWAFTAENSTGAITGIRNLLTGEGIGRLLISADMLQISDPNGGAPIRVLDYDLDNIVRLQNVTIEGDLVVVGSITTERVAANAISAGDTASLASPIAGNGAWHDAVTYNLTIPVSDPPVDWQAIAIVTGSQSFPSGDRDWNARLKADGGQIAAAGGQKSEDSFALSGRAIWGAGAHSFTLEWNGQSGASLVEANMVILWLKR